MELRVYQGAAIDALFAYFEEHYGNPLCVMPTGTGKSVVIGGFCRRAISHYTETRILNLTHVKELIAQNFAALIRQWPEAPAGIYSASLNKRDIRAQILFAGIQSIWRKAFQVQRCDIVIIDEAHLIGKGDAGMYRKFLADLLIINPHLKVIGFTATPYRMDSGKLHEGEGRLFTDIAYEVKILDMFKQGYLSPVTTIPTETTLDISGVGTRAGDYIAGQLEAAVMAGDTTARAVQEFVTMGANRGSWLAFCAGVAHAAQVRDAIRAHGIDAEMVTGDTPAAERDRMLRAFKAGRLRAITNANVLTTGFDAPGLDLIGMFRPTKSVVLYVQMIGRGTRLAEGKTDCLVADFAGNVAMHGPIDLIDVRTKKEKANGEAPTKECPECGKTNYAGVRRCIECGFEFPPPEIEIAEQATDAAIISTQIVPQWLDVTDVTFREYQKPGSPPTLEVSYWCGLNRHRKWVCLQHSGHAREQACKWWMQHSAIPVPFSVSEALAATAEIKKPSAIRVLPAGKFNEITHYRFA